MYFKRIEIGRENGKTLVGAIIRVGENEGSWYFVCDESLMWFHGDSPASSGVRTEGLSTWWICDEDIFLRDLRDYQHSDDSLPRAIMARSISLSESITVRRDCDLLALLGGAAAVTKDAPSEERGDDFLMLDTYSDDVHYEGFHDYHHHHGRTPNVPLVESGKAYKVGVELEVECNSDYDKDEVTECESNWFYREHDGSLGTYGVEFITVPLRYEDASDMSFWRPFCSWLNPHAKSWRCRSTGLHVHVGREILGATAEEQSETIGKLLFFYHHLIGDNSGARSVNCRLYGREHTYSEHDGKTVVGGAAATLGTSVFSSEDVRDRVKSSMIEQNSTTRYFDINLANSATIEFRKGKGSISAERISAIVEWSVRMTEYCRDTKWEDLSFRDFFESVRNVESIKRILG